MSSRRSLAGRRDFGALRYTLSWKGGASPPTTSTRFASRPVDWDRGGLGMMYQRPRAEQPLSQGDILEDCPLLLWEIRPSDTDAEPEPATIRARVVVLTQACDLAQEKATRVLVAVVHNAPHLVERGVVTARIIRDHIRTHRVYGWYFLPSGPALDESIVDLRNLHTIPRTMLDQLIRTGKPVCRIASPYREHLAQHFSTTYSRIGLPEPYESQPGTWRFRGKWAYKPARGRE